jgi:hypothetical protein
MNKIGETKTAFKLHTSALYRDITEIEFTPEEEVKVELRRKAGEKRQWRFLGILPLWEYTVKENAYKLTGYYSPSRIFKNMNEILDWYGTGRHLLRDNKVYKKAEVYVRCVNRNNNETRYFSSDAEALNYIEELKRKCKECGNTLS